MPKPHPSWSLLRIFTTTTTADESTVWALPPPPTDVRFVVATWCKAHRRWYNPRTCFRCLSTHTQVGVRVGPEVVRRVVSVQEGMAGASTIGYLLNLIASVAQCMPQWLRPAWKEFSSGDSLSSRKAARLLRSVKGCEDVVLAPATKGEDESRVETWSLSREDPDPWRAAVARGRALNTVLSRLGSGLPDSLWRFAASQARDVVSACGGNTVALYPYVVACLEDVLDCALVLQAYACDETTVLKRFSAAAAGFVWMHQTLGLPLLDGSIRLLSPDQVDQVLDEVVGFSPTGRFQTAPHIQTFGSKLDRARPFGADFGIDPDTKVRFPVDFLLAAKSRESDPPDDDRLAAFTITANIKSRAPSPGSFRVAPNGALRRL